MKHLAIVFAILLGLTLFVFMNESHNVDYMGEAEFAYRYQN